MSEKIKGIVEKKETSAGTSANGKPWKRASFIIGGLHYSTFDEKVISGYDSGDSVEIEFDTSDDGKYKNITSIKKVEFTPADQVSEPKVDQSVWDKKDRRIVRQNVLRTASMALSTLAEIDKEKAKQVLGDNQLIDLLMNVAESLESWVYRPIPE